MVDATMVDDELLSGTALLEKVEDFLRGFEPLLDHVKVTVVVGGGARAIAMRCHAIEGLADVLADRAKLAVLAHQHDVILVVGNVVLLGGDVSWLKQHDMDGREIDITTWKDTIEVKSRSDIGPLDVAAFVGDHFDEMVASKESKGTWWLCFLMKRRPPKGTLVVGCMYYLNIVELPTAGLVADEACRESTCNEAMRVSEELEKQVIDENAVDEGFLVPVNNIWIVDKLRMENDALKAALKAALEEKDKALEEKDKIIAEFKQRQGED